jgi:opacity protein-like surface antigen
LADNAGFLAGLGGPSAAGLNTTGYMLGGQIGCDYQFMSGLLLGVEGSAAGGNIGGNTLVAVPGDNATFKQTTDFLSDGTVRVGYAWDRWLPYVKGGAAWAGDRYSVFDAAAFYDAEAVETRLGWVVGAGVEWALWDDWSIKLEYNYYGFGTRGVTFIDNEWRLRSGGRQAGHSGGQAWIELSRLRGTGACPMTTSVVIFVAIAMREHEAAT